MTIDNHSITTTTSMQIDSYLDFHFDFFQIKFSLK